jgi:uncharacterized protein (TIGR02284 family)
MNKEKTIDVLNTLIGINNDRIERYETACKETEEKDLIILFDQFIQTSKMCKAELVSKVQLLDGKLIEETKKPNKFFQILADVKAAFIGKDRITILYSCEDAEGVVVNVYSEALNNNTEDLPVELQVMLNAHIVLIKADLDKVKYLLDTLYEHK